MRIVAFVLFFILGAAPAAYAETRVALVVGNSAYRYAGELANPKNDADDMAAVLSRHSFRVLKGFDLDKRAFDGLVRDFDGALKGADTGLFFYAGHGLQVAGQNYLLPIDAKAEGVGALSTEMVRLEDIQRVMEAAAKTNILLLDACRDNPLVRNLARSMGTRSSDVRRGLVAAESGVGTLISFSTQPGNVALDGTGRNSPYSRALIRRIGASRNDLSAILIDVRNDVINETQCKQVPWEHSALTGRFYFGDLPPAGIQAPSTALTLLRPKEAGVQEPDVREAFTLRGGRSRTLLNGRVALFMHGTPYAGYRTMAGVTLQGQRKAMRSGDFALIKDGRRSCVLRLESIKEGQNQADFVVSCGGSAAGFREDDARLIVRIDP